MKRILMNNIGSVLLGTLLVVLSTSVWSYDDAVTHPDLSLQAATISDLSEGTLLTRLGLPPTSIFRFIYRARIGDRILAIPQRYNVAELIGEGAFDEDIGARALNHFYDPLFNRPLTVGGVSGTNRTSWEWILESAGPISDQHRSLQDAKDYLYKALTYNEGAPEESHAARGRVWGELFLSLGSAVHHMQDMAQPQHVRNDQHCDKWYCFHLENRSRYEAYTAERRVVVNTLAASASPVYPGATRFQWATDFWFNDIRPGIAQFTNRHFVSQGTNFTIDGDQVNTGTYPEPRPIGSMDYPIGQLFADVGERPKPEIIALCEENDLPVDCTMTMFSTPLSQKASTLSIFDQDLVTRGLTVSYTSSAMGPSYTTERLFALNRFNFDDAHKILIPKAVGYSAGLINHFFRGSLEVGPPALGAYAVADHATAHGFNTIKAIIRNTTPNETMNGGVLIAVAKFHRNKCYRADLSGEFTQDAAGNLIPPCPDYRSAEEYIVTSTEQTLTLGPGEQRELTFTLDGYIPMDATDLYLQVVYRGILGDESDSVAVGTVNLAEPTFLAIMNATDVFFLYDTFYYYQDIIDNITQPPYDSIDSDRNGAYNSPPDADVEGRSMDHEIYLDGGKIAAIDALPEGRFARLALLVNPGTFNLHHFSSDGVYSRLSSYQMSARAMQVEYEGGAVFIVPIVTRLRNHTLQWLSITSFRGYPTIDARIEMMPPSNAAEAEVPVPLRIER